ncbi:MAG: lactate dehydrogenase [Methanoregulaceae archaeon]|nr:lactate dehydrogenase [Methanoregulaceae archaeon]
MVRLAVLGAGRIGGEVAYLSSVLSLVDELVIYDANKPFLHSQVLDLQHTGLDIPISTDPWEASRADICVFSAGIPRTPAIRTRADLLGANLPVATECSKPLSRFGGVLITVTNPMDANNYYLCRHNRLDRSKCIGFGGQVDSARFRLALGRHRIGGEAWVLGDHGEHQVPVFSRLSVPVPVPDREEILAGLRRASMEVIEGKGGTVFGPAYHIARLIRMVVRDERELVACSCVLEGEYGMDGCSLGVPARIGREGILRIEEWDLDDWERQGLGRAGEFIRDLSRGLR